EEEQGPEEEDPLKPSLYTLEGEVAALNVVIDVAVEGVRKQEELRFGEELEAALNEKTESILANFRDALEQAQNNEPITFQWIEEPEIDSIQAAIVELDPEEQNLFKEIYTNVDDLLTLIHKGFDDVISEYQYIIDTNSTTLLTDDSLQDADKAALTAEIASAATIKSAIATGKFFMPETPKTLAIDAALSVVGFPIIKRVPGLLRGALSHVDDVTGTKLTAKFANGIDEIGNKIDGLVSKLANKTSHSLNALKTEYKHIDVEHILDASINTNGSRPVGGHFWKALDRSDVSIDAIKGVDENGVIEAVLTAIDPDTGKLLRKTTHTFFPTSWSDRQIIEAIDDAFKKTNPVDWGEKGLWKSESGGIEIWGYVDNNGKIPSAFPKLKQ
ncbi:MAG: EndoU domain-containing protein, partial [Kiritimatiellales bacterium]|nr:EndoU domain-containing protein [Kiritimatiellales bacterium]